MLVKLKNFLARLSRGCKHIFCFHNWHLFFSSSSRLPIEMGLPNIFGQFLALVVRCGFIKLGSTLILVCSVVDIFLTACSFIERERFLWLNDFHRFTLTLSSEAPATYSFSTLDTDLLFCLYLLAVTFFFIMHPRSNAVLSLLFPVSLFLLSAKLLSGLLNTL